MSSTTTRTATRPVAVPAARLRRSDLQLPAAVAAPAALVIAVDARVSQETSARTQVFRPVAAAVHGSAAAHALLNARKQGLPTRGTPV